MSNFLKKMNNSKRIIEEKLKQARRKVEKKTISNNTRLPPGQTLTSKFPILDLGIIPDIDISNWKLRIFGLVKKELNISFEELKNFSQTQEISDFHCVTHWSKFDVQWGGVIAKEILDSASILKEADFATLYSYDNYTTNIPLKVLLDKDVIIAHQVYNKPLSLEHGGPVRMVIPKRYAWKSAKWLKAIEIHKGDKLGFWEVRGYNNNADPWKEERYSE
jgi:DMSO/TMAO reductase YedYZ molybdopterin-dependent catalytic subunit